MGKRNCQIPLKIFFPKWAWNFPGASEVPGSEIYRKSWKVDFDQLFMTRKNFLELPRGTGSTRFRRNSKLTKNSIWSTFPKFWVFPVRNRKWKCSYPVVSGLKIFPPTTRTRLHTQFFTFLAIYGQEKWKPISWFAFFVTQRKCKTCYDKFFFIDSCWLWAALTSFWHALEKI